MKYLNLILIFFILSFSNCKNSKDNFDSNNLKKYRDKNFNFSFDYPACWEVKYGFGIPPTENDLRKIKGVKIILSDSSENSLNNCSESDSLYKGFSDFELSIRKFPKDSIENISIEIKQMIESINDSEYSYSFIDSLKCLNDKYFLIYDYSDTQGFNGYFTYCLTESKIVTITNTRIGDFPKPNPIPPKYMTDLISSFEIK